MLVDKDLVARGTTNGGGGDPRRVGRHPATNKAAAAVAVCRDSWVRDNRIS